MRPTSPHVKEVAARSRELVAADRLGENAELLREAVSRFPDDAELHLMAGAATRAVGSHEEAERLSRRGGELAWDDPHRLTWAASQILDQGNVDEAQRWVGRVYELAPDDFEFAAELTHLVGRLALARGREDDAEKALRMAFELDSDTRAHGRVLAALLQRLGRMDEALEVLERAVRARPDDEQLRDALERLVAGRTGEDSDSRDGASSYDSSPSSLDEPPLAETLRRFRRGEASIDDVRDALQRSSVLVPFSGNPATGEVTLATVPDERPYAVALFSSSETLRAAVGDDAPWWEVAFLELTSGWSSDTDAVIDPGSDWSLRLPAHTLRPE
jgi:tetratricopeptide (TPR) repeat protein